MPTSAVSTARTGFRGSSTLVWWVVVAVIVGVVGWMKTINILLLVSYTLTALLFINAFLAYRMTRRLSARRLAHPPAFAGEEIVLHAEIANQMGRAKSVTIAEVAPPSLAVAWVLPHFPGGSSVRASTKVTFANRGRHRLPPLIARSGYPFGLLTHQRALAVAGEQVVLPPLGTVNARLMKRFLIRAGHGDDRSRRPAARYMPSDGDVRGLRPHRAGDGVRDIHWKTSARRGQWMVREYDQTAPLDLVVIVDPWVPSLPTERNSQRKLEWALSLAITAAWAWVHEERPGSITLAIFGETATVQSGPGTPLFIREHFHGLAGVVGTPNIAVGSVFGVREIRRKAARLLISTRPRSPVAAAIRSAGLSLAVVDPTSAAKWFSLPPDVALPTPTGTRDAP